MGIRLCSLVPTVEEPLHYAPADGSAPARILLSACALRQYAQAAPMCTQLSALGLAGCDSVDLPCLALP